MRVPFNTGEVRPPGEMGELGAALEMTARPGILPAAKVDRRDSLRKRRADHYNKMIPIIPT